MVETDDEEEQLLRSAALQSANAILLARQRVEEELLRAKETLESRTAELERALLDVQTQLEITGVLVNAKAIDEVASALLETLCRKLSWKCAQLWRVDRGAGVARLSAGWCDPAFQGTAFEALARIDSMKRGVGLPGRIWQSRQPAWVEEIALDENFTRASLARDIGFRSVFAFPMIVAGEVSAIIELFSTERRAADEATMKMAAILGSHIGQFIERAAAEGEQTKALKQLDRLQDVTQTALANLPLGQLFESVLSKICEAVAFDMAAVLLLDDKTNELQLGAIFGASPEPLQSLRVSLGESLAGRVAAERRFIMVRDAPRDLSIRSELRTLGFQTILGIPLLARNRLIGVLELGSVADRELTIEEIEFIQLLGQQVAMAIENSSLYEEAREANRIKDRFLSVASHELRTPLTAILGWTEMLKRIDTDEIRAEAMPAIENSARTLAELIEDLLDASRIREGKLVLRRESIDLKSIVQGALKTVTPAAYQRGVKLETDLSAEVPAIEGDPGRIRQVLWNLLINAVKFTPPGKAVTTRLELADDAAVVIVQDQGEGISPDFLPHVFSALRQEEKGRRAGGLGLGLHIVKTIVDLHGGSVEAHSAGRGQGATFIVRLPVAGAAARTS